MEFKQITQQKYNGGLFLNNRTNMLTWNSGAKVNNYIIIKAPSATDIDLSSPEFQETLSGIEQELINTKQVQINQIEVSILSNSDFVRANRNYKVTGGNCQYWVFAADVTDSVTCYIYDNANKLLQNNKAEVISQINVLCEKVTESSGGLFKKVFKSKSRTYRRITVTTNNIYNDSDIYYVIKDFKYPIMCSMVGEKSSFCLDIPHDVKISFSADDKNIEINVNEKEVN